MFPQNKKAEGKQQTAKKVGGIDLFKTSPTKLHLMLTKEALDLCEGDYRPMIERCSIDSIVKDYQENGFFKHKIDNLLI